MKSLRSRKVALEKKDQNVESPFKNPNIVDNSLSINRPKRVSRLPSRFEDHSISPSKFIPLQPCHASTPIVQNKAKTKTVKSKVVEKKPNSPIKKSTQVKVVTIVQNKAKTETVKSKVVEKKSNSPIKKSTPVKEVQKRVKQTSILKSDTNNNPKRTRATRAGNELNTVKDKPEPVRRKIVQKEKSIPNNTSLFRILGEKPNSKKSSKSVDVYEFTFDPDKEPTPKKKKKIPAKKKTTVKKPKPVVFKNNYNKNIAKALADLKSKLTVNDPNTQQKDDLNLVESKKTSKEIDRNDYQTQSNDINKPSSSGTSFKPANADNYASIRIEDIAADFEESMNHENIDYSPVNSPVNPVSPPHQHDQLAEKTNPKPVNRSNDPLNLQESLSFFDDQPVASSSIINTSVRQPLASPWRVEFTNLPIRWQSNTYMKPNMTPALESSFINSDESRKKHVYTNLIPETNDSMEFITNDVPKLKQTSIIDFIREAAEKSVKKKKQIAAKTPNYVFDDVPNTGTQESNEKSSDVSAPNNVSSDNPEPENVNNVSENIEDNISDDIENLSSSKENVSPKQSRKRKNGAEINEPVPAKSPRRKTFFGFDDSTNADQENMSPEKKAVNRRRHATRSRTALRELNQPAGPMRVVVVPKTKLDANSDVVKKLYNELKEAEPVIAEMQAVEKTHAANVSEPSWQEDSISVHLFEDADMVVKPPRKSYGKAKKVAFRQPSSSDSDMDNNVADQAVSSEGEDLSDLSFHIPSEKVKKPAKKKQNNKKKKLNKKEQQEVEAWAAGFNSMCEDVEGFDLVVE